jgi:hypothetical protein
MNSIMTDYVCPIWDAAEDWKGPAFPSALGRRVSVDLRALGIDISHHEGTLVAASTAPAGQKAAAVFRYAIEGIAEEPCSDWKRWISKIYDSGVRFIYVVPEARHEEATKG